jgi:hypothetical protein
MRAALAIVVLTIALAGVPSALGALAPNRGPVDPGILDGSRQHRLDRARKAWRDAGVRSYSYRVRLTCFCGEQPNARMVVRGGRPAAGTPKDMRELATVPRLFRKIQSSIDDKVASIGVRYGRRGVPSSIAIDVDQRLADEESYYTITRFTPLKPRAG